LINLAFGEDGFMKEEAGTGRILYQPGSIILKLWKWGYLYDVLGQCTEL